MLSEQGNPFSLFAFFQLPIFIHRGPCFLAVIFQSGTLGASFLKSCLQPNAVLVRSWTAGHVLSPSPWHGFPEAGEIAWDSLRTEFGPRQARLTLWMSVP